MIKILEQKNKDYSSYKYWFQYSCDNSTYGYNFKEICNANNALKVSVKIYKPDHKDYYLGNNIVIIVKSQNDYDNIINSAVEDRLTSKSITKYNTHSGLIEIGKLKELDWNKFDMSTVKEM